MLRLLGVAADAGQIRHRLVQIRLAHRKMIRCAKNLGLKARAIGRTGRGLQEPLPAIASLSDGGFIVVAKAAEDKVLVQSPQTRRPALMTRDEFVAIWDCQLIMIVRRAGLSDITRRFDITWFLGAIHKYRHLLSEVLIVVLLAAVRTGLAAILPGGHRQGAGAPGVELPSTSGRRSGGDLDR
jgi:subfamily B ATP-binding cassette protein HlyB/CyaB